MCQDIFLGDLGNIDVVRELGLEAVEEGIKEVAASAIRKCGHNNAFTPPGWLEE